MKKIKEILLEKTQLVKDDKYSYCIHCLKKYKDAGKDYHELPRLVYIKYMNVYMTKDGEHKEIDDYYLCPSCKSKLTIDDFVDAYTLRTDGSRWRDNGQDLARKSI